MGAPKWVGVEIARRNMPIVAVGAITVALFSAMLGLCLLLDVPCPIDGFDVAAHKSEAVEMRYTATSCLATIVLVCVAVFAVNCVRRKSSSTVPATAATIALVFIMAMVWGIAVSGNPADRQVLVFASIQFLVAGLVVFNPIVALAYFGGAFFAFGSALQLSGMLDGIFVKDLVYLALLDVVVCWVVYGLFLRATERERVYARQSQRDELTGAKNRHCLRNDFASYHGAEVFVMLCDIDDFKHYNDDYDHDVGDELLRQFYFALREAFGDECIYRYGGDEFLVVSPEFGDEEFGKKVKKVADQLALVEVRGLNAGLTYSGGCVRGAAADDAGFRDLLHTADENLLEAKRTGKDRIIGA